MHFAIRIAHKIQLQEYSRGSDKDGVSHNKRLWRNPKSDNLCAPYFYRDSDNRKLNLNNVDNKWNDNWVFVAFRDSLIEADSATMLAEFSIQGFLPSADHLADFMERHRDSPVFLGVQAFNLPGYLYEKL